MPRPYLKAAYLIGVCFLLIHTLHIAAYAHQLETLPADSLPQAMVTSSASVFVPQFRTGFEPDELAVSPPEAITWMVFENTSDQPDATPWAMSVYYESPGTQADRYAKIITDPLDATNHVLYYWLKNAVIDAGYNAHTKGRIQSGFPQHLDNAVEIYSRQRMMLHNDLGLLLDYPANADPWWIGIVIGEYWMGAAWENSPNPSAIGLSVVPYNGAMRLFLHHRTMPDLTTLWQEMNLEYAMPIGEWFTIEIGYRMGDATTGRVVVIVTPESTGESTVVLDVTNWTYDPQADLPGGAGPVAATHWNPQKVYSSDNVIHYVRDRGGVVQLYFDDFEFSGSWPLNWP